MLLSHGYYDSIPACCDPYAVLPAKAASPLTAAHGNAATYLSRALRRMTVSIYKTLTTAAICSPVKHFSSAVRVRFSPEELPLPWC
jgi:hypothetical protein